MKKMKGKNINNCIVYRYLIVVCLRGLDSKSISRDFTGIKGWLLLLLMSTIISMALKHCVQRLFMLHN